MLNYVVLIDGNAYRFEDSRNALNFAIMATDHSVINISTTIVITKDEEEETEI